MKSELLAPGGGLDSAMAALENGTDAVYCGLQEFSARKGAKNFTIDQLSRLRQWSFQNSKKIYITLNTILKEDELPGMLRYLSRLEELEVDSIILQDPGLARIIGKHFPGLTMHGSTQMAVHNLSGMRTLKEMGLTRVVLPREMSLKEISIFHQEMPEMELEVFIHGAQCYGFSGMCLASGMILGRSANRGECGQICRTWFNRDENRGYFLSSTDLWAGDRVLKLQETGVSSLKIEGRMKSPAYAASVSRYYRAVLDGRSSQELKPLEEDLRISFSRQSGTGHLESKKGLFMVDRDFPGHRGLPLGEVRSSRGKSISLDSPVALNRRDGLMFLTHRGEAKSFSLESKQTLKPGRVSIDLPFQAPPAGTVLYKVQSHDFHTPGFNENSLKPFQKALKATLSFGSQIVGLSVPSLGFEADYPLQSEESTGGKSPVDKILKEFSKSGTSIFTLADLTLSDAPLKSEGSSLDSRFFPPAALKKMRQQVYRDIEEHADREREKRAEALEHRLQEDSASLTGLLEKLPERASLNPGGSDLPVITPKEVSELKCAEIEGKSYYPLSPLVFPQYENEYINSLEKNLASGSGQKMAGIGNWGHIGIFRELKSRNPAELFCYGETSMLLANSQSVLLMRDLLGPDFKAGYGWIEGEKGDYPDVLTPPGSKFRPPLFISRNCFKRHSLQLSCKDCPKHMDYTMNQKGKSYRVLVRDCLTWIFQDN